MKHNFLSKSWYFAIVILLWGNVSFSQKFDTQTFVNRTDTFVEVLKVKVSRENSVAFEIVIQGTKYPKATQLKILKTNLEEQRIYTEHPVTKEKITFYAFWAMGGSKVLPDGSMQEYFSELKCKNATGEILTTSGGPMFLPFFYAPNATAPLKSVKILNADQIPATTPKGESYYDVSLPGKKGKYKIIMQPYKENDTTTRLTLISPEGKKTVFSGNW